MGTSLNERIYDLAKLDYFKTNNYCFITFTIYLYL